MKRGAIILFLLAAASLMYVIGNLELEDITSAAVIDTKTPEIPEETNNPPEVYFCPRDNCSSKLIKFIENAETVHCALFDIDIEPLINSLKEKKALVVVDDNNYAEELSFMRKDTSSQLSHNKFCIFDNEIVWTGSFNPTFRGDTMNNNNVVVFYSEYLAKNYEAEFQELWNGEFGKGKRIEYPVIYLNGKRIENYFCPEDWCANKVLHALNNATESIYFMLFSFTHDAIGDMLVKKHREGLDVMGVMEKSQNNAYAEFDRLNESGIKVMWDKNKANMHHKVFIIDNKTVITGSFNPTNNGDTNNDENLVIIHDRLIAKKYLEEFEMVSDSII